MGAFCRSRRIRDHFADLTHYRRKCEIWNPRHIAFQRWRISEVVLWKPTVSQVLIFSKYVSGVIGYRKLEICPFSLFIFEVVVSPFFFGCRRNFNYMKGEGAPSTKSPIGVNWGKSTSSSNALHYFQIPSRRVDAFNIPKKDLDLMAYL